MRLALLAAIVGLVTWLTIRFVVRPLIVRFRDLDLALRIEDRWPGLQDRLASTVEFLRIDRAPDAADRADGLTGSAKLRQATIDSTLREVQSLDFAQVIDRKPVRRAWGAALGAVTLGALTLVLAPQTSRIALDRLFRPLGATEWPKRTHLSVVAAPDKVARGDEYRFEIAVAPGERLPATARVTYRYPDGTTAVEALRPEPTRGRFHGRIESARQSFSFTVAAGDDATAPRDVRVVPPPAVTALTLRVTPPEYTGLAPETLAPGRTQVQAVRGSTLDVIATASKPIATASLRPSVARRSRRDRSTSPAATPAVFRPSSSSNRPPGSRSS
jgi:hypothetical protein